MKALLTVLRNTLSCAKGAGLGLHGIAGITGAQPTFDPRGIVVNMDNRGLRRAPRRDQGCDIGFRAGIVARAPGWIVEPKLHVDDEQGSVGRECFHAFKS